MRTSLAGAGRASGLALPPRRDARVPQARGFAMHAWRDLACGKRDPCQGCPAPLRPSAWTWVSLRRSSAVVVPSSLPVPPNCRAWRETKSRVSVQRFLWRVRRPHESTAVCRG